MDGTAPEPVVNFMKDLLRGYPSIVNAEVLQNRETIMLVGNPVQKSCLKQLTKFLTSYLKS